MPHPEKFKFSPGINWKKVRDDEIAARYGCCAQTVKSYRMRHGLPHGPRKPGSGRPRKYKRHKLRLDKPPAWNAERIGCHVNWARAMMKEACGIAAPVKPRRGRRRKTRALYPWELSKEVRPKRRKRRKPEAKAEPVISMDEGVWL